MTLSEFKAWFSGYTESMDSTPNEKQWARIKARVDEISGVAITQTVYLDRYIDRTPYRPYWSYSSFGNMAIGAASADGLVCQDNSDMDAYKAALKSSNFDSHAAMHDLGRAEYSAVA